MTVASHIAELERRHSALERQIETSRLSPASDPLKTAELKRKKLKLRDEIEKLRAQGRIAVH
ncbi:YdcH family protein [Methylocella sp. CPCC 101449]|jgi:hypothetical protein|uniref:YdcH family protein n=1 Tax=Methylocella sp. CPCC 101449 TaxID=2987531 RepID=UPI000969FC8E|nr:DUF465 domain-containing protein [Methylocella sp. CPCC 101449]MBN9083823.1 DUF465 domain-containing protein [Hyphomicrobiales bacterium]MDT2023681.1 DUF465 domain-containing protein [Methylocella sp. CPCC 101449]OJY03332.1 MAG: DUF465 domain-containing protein [Rhizobiales bacterium 62-17]HEV2573781.1 DUF465 domain-containing protein [Beijerinckiaceae bacterium]